MSPDLPAPASRPGRWQGLRPAPAMLAPALLWAGCGLAVNLGQLPARYWWLAGAVLALLAGIDAWYLARRASPQVRRLLPEVWPLDVGREVVLEIDGYRRQTLDVFDHVPAHWQQQGLPRRLSLRPGQCSRLRYQATPQRRGAARFAGVDLRLFSSLRLWTQLRHTPPGQQVRVYPDFMPLTRLALHSAERASQLIGAHIQRRRGEGTDFHQMRDYRIGDSLRHVDWKATSRVRRLISREYQDEKNQQLVLLLDTGQRLLARDDGRNHFDDVLNAALLLAWLALRQGDAVAMAAHGGEQRWVAGKRGPGHLDTLLRACHDLHPQPVATDYLAAASELSVRQRRRSLVVLLTNIRDEDSDELLAAVQLLKQRHLVCVASLQETALQAMLVPQRDTPHGGIHAAAAAHYLAQRAQVHDALRRHGVDVLDVTPAALPAALVNHYLAIKRAGRL